VQDYLLCGLMQSRDRASGRRTMKQFITTVPPDRPRTAVVPGTPPVTLVACAGTACRSVLPAAL
jgi:hypothetical protein